MKLRFKAIGQSPLNHAMASGSINNVDLSSFPEGGRFTGDSETLAKGIMNVERINGELHVTLGQPYLSYECQPVNGSHDWRGTGDWIDAADYDPDQCYIVPISAPPGATCVKRENGWTVAMPQTEESAA
ncbi:hypothetical protein ACQKFL_11525 [Vreelandella titanicae]|uniref:hypothetical protein n=1 Tax=Vreelandella titanicae TaxID=664683 RepID=UPI003D05F379